MSVPNNLMDLKEAKLIKDMDFQILICKERIRNHMEAIKKTKRMSGMNGPAVVSAAVCSGMPNAGFTHMDFPDALMALAKEEECIEKEREQIRLLRRRKKNLIGAAEKLEGIERSIFVCRVLRRMSQEATAETVGISVRQLQRTERQMKGERGILGM